MRARSTADILIVSVISICQALITSSIMNTVTWSNFLATNKMRFYPTLVSIGLLVLLVGCSIVTAQQSDILKDSDIEEVELFANVTQPTKPANQTTIIVLSTTTLAPTTTTNETSKVSSNTKSSPSVFVFAVLIGAIVVLLLCLLYYMFFGRRDSIESFDNAGGAKSVRRASGFKSIRKAVKSPQEQPTPATSSVASSPRQAPASDHTQVSPAVTVRSALTDASQLMTPVTGASTATTSGTATVQTPRTTDSRSPSPVAAASKIAGTKSTISPRKSKASEGGSRKVAS